MAKKATIAGNTFLFTGKLTEFTREDAEAHVEAEGGKVLSGVSAKLNYLVVGEDAGSKLAKAKALGTVTILHEKEFLKMMNSGKKAPAKAAPKKTVKATAKAAPKKITKSTAKVNSVSKQDSTKTAIDEIKIGKQTWCVKNLDVANFRNGDPIPEALTLITYTYFTVGDQFFGDHFELLEHGLFWFIGFLSWIIFIRVDKIQPFDNFSIGKKQFIASTIFVVAITAVTTFSIFWHNHTSFVERTQAVNAEQITENKYNVII